MKVAAEFITWAYRILLGRDPESQKTIERVIAANLQPSEYVKVIMHSEEFGKRYRAETKTSNAWCWAEVEDLLLRVNLIDIFISWAVLEKSFEPAETKFVKSALRPGFFALDIGAHLGYYTILFASIVRREGRVYSFEPMPFLFDSVVKSIQRNGLGGYVLPFNAALADKRGDLEMIYAPASRNWGGASFLAGREVLPGHETIKVRSGPLPDLCLPERLDFVKIDVEGAEPQVMRGCKDVLLKNKPIVLSEIHVPLLKAVSKQNADDYVGLMDSLGYDCKLLTGSGDLGESIDTRKIAEVTNVVFVPK